VCGQLVADTGGRIDADTVARYHRGRAEVSGFTVADRAVLGDVPGALEALRWALAIGVAHVLVADALADGIRTIARVTGAGRGDAYQLAGTLGMPPWKVKRAQSQARGWSEPGAIGCSCRWVF
jgi:DNA polymerase-3 subunit delta